MKYIKGWGNLALGFVKGPRRAVTDEFYGFTSIKYRKRSIFVTDCYLKDSAFRAVKRDAKVQTWYFRGVSLVSKRYTKGERDTFFMKNGI